MLTEETSRFEQILSSSSLTSHSDVEFVEGLSASEAHRRAISACRLIGNARQHLALWLIEINERKLYCEFSCSSVYQYAAIHLSLDGHTVAEYLRTGKALSNLPLLSEAYRKGEISSSKVREITRVAVPETDSFWAETARRCTTREIEKMVVYTPGGGLPLQKMKPGKESPAISREERAHTGGAVISCKEEPTMKREALPVKKDEHSEGCSSMAAADADAIDGGGVEERGIAEKGVEERSIRYREKLIIDISGEQMAVVKDAFAKARKESGQKDRASLIAFIARAYVEGTSEAQGTRSKPPYQIVIHHHPESGRSWCESLKGEHYLPASTLSKALCDAEIVEMREDTAGPCHHEGPISLEGDSGVSEETPAVSEELTAQSPTVGLPEPDHENERLVSFITTLYAGYKVKKNGGCEKHDNLSGGEIHRSGNHTVPRKLRREVMLRDEHCCQAPGCGRRLFLVIHHIDPMACGGMTIKANLLVLCWQCHDLVHMGWLGVSGEAPSKLIWRDKEGKILR